jgi:hypothetical protein
MAEILSSACGEAAERLLWSVSSREGHESYARMAGLLLPAPRYPQSVHPTGKEFGIGPEGDYGPAFEKN